MPALEPRYSSEEFARRGEEMYQRDVVPRLQAADQGKFVAIDIETGDYAMDSDDFVATERLASRKPSAQIWLVCIGRSATYRMGGAIGRVMIQELA